MIYFYHILALDICLDFASDIIEKVKIISLESLKSTWITSFKDRNTDFYLSENKEEWGTFEDDYIINIG